MNDEIQLHPAFMDIESCSFCGTSFISLVLRDCISHFSVSPSVRPTVTKVFLQCYSVTVSLNGRKETLLSKWSLQMSFRKKLFA